MTSHKDSVNSDTSEKFFLDVSKQKKLTNET